MCLDRSKSSKNFRASRCRAPLTWPRRYLASPSVSTKNNITWAGQVRFFQFYCISSAHLVGIRPLATSLKSTDDSRVSSTLLPLTVTQLQIHATSPSRRQASLSSSSEIPRSSQMENPRSPLPPPHTPKRSTQRLSTPHCWQLPTASLERRDSNWEAQVREVSTALLASIPSCLDSLYSLPWLRELWW